MDAKMRYANLEKGAPRPRRSTARGCILPLLVYVAVLLTGIVVTLPIVLWHQHSALTIAKQDNKEELTEPEAIAAASHHTPKEGFVEHSMSWFDTHLGKMTERIGVDTESQMEIITSEYLGTQIASYLDFKKSLGAFYISDWDECYMVGGLDHRLIKPQEVASFLGDTRNQEIHASPELVIYEKADDYPITDKSLLPQDLAAKCENKDVFWLRQTYLDQESVQFDQREKRAANKRDRKFVRVCFGLCMVIGLKDNQ